MSALDRELQFLEQSHNDSFNMFTTNKSKQQVSRNSARDRHNVDLDDYGSVYSWRSSERTVASKKADSARFASRGAKAKSHPQPPATPRKLSANLRVSSTRRPRTKTRTDSATYNANNTSNIYQNGQRKSTNAHARTRATRSRSLPRMKSAKQNEVRLREKESIYGNLSTSRFFSQPH